MEYKVGMILVLRDDLVQIVGLEDDGLGGRWYRFIYLRDRYNTLPGVLSVRVAHRSSIALRDAKIVPLTPLENLIYGIEEV